MLCFFKCFFKVLSSLVRRHLFDHLLWFIFRSSFYTCYTLQIKAAVDTSDYILLGDFNLNFDKKNDINYSHASYFDDFEHVLSDKNMIQLIEFPTWSRIINNVLIESLLDHIYVKDPTTVCEIQSTKPLFGDHLLVSVTLRLERKVYVSSLRRDWRKYSKEVLLSKLMRILRNYTNP